LKALTRFLNKPNRVHNIFCLRLKQIAKPPGNEIKESREALELPEKCGTSEQRKQRKEVKRREGVETVKCFCVQSKKIML